MRQRGNTYLVHNLPCQVFEAFGQTDAGFGDEVDRAEFQCAHGDVGATFGQGRYHDHGGGAQAHEAAQEFNAVHFWHFDVQRNDVRIEFADHFPRDQGVIGGADAFHVGLAIDDFSQQAAHQGRIVYDYHAYFFHTSP